MHALDYAAVVAYLLVTMGIIYRAQRRQRTSEDFFLGGRRMPWLAVGLSIMATLLSTQTYLGAPGEMIRYGPTYTFGYLSYPLIAVVVMYVWIPFFMRLRLLNAYDYLERRYDRNTRLLGSLYFLGLRLGWISMVVYTASLACVTMIGAPLVDLAHTLGFDTPMVPVIFAIGLVSTLYARLGGMQAMIWTDVLQAIMLFGGVLLIIGQVMLADGSGVVTWWQVIRTHGASPPEIQLFSTDVTVRVTLFATMFSMTAWHLCTHCADQVALQRYFTTDSISSARKSLLVSIGSSAIIGILLSISGLALRYHYLVNPERLPAGIAPEDGADKLMPWFYANELPIGFAGLILVSFLCDAMQTLVAGVNSIAAIFTRDIFRGSHVSEANEARGARLVTFGVGLIASWIAVQVAYFVMARGQTIFDMMPRIFNMFLGPLASLFLTGMFVRRATARTAIPAALLAMTFSFLWSWWSEVPHLFTRFGLDGLAAAWTSILGVDAAGHPKGPTIMMAVGMPCLFGIAVGWLLATLAGRDVHPGLEFTWRKVLLQPAPQPNE